MESGAQTAAKAGMGMVVNGGMQGHGGGLGGADGGSGGGLGAGVGMSFGAGMDAQGGGNFPK